MHEDETFRECATCAAKSGMPLLCASCIHNRAAISKLRADRCRAERRADQRATLIGTLIAARKLAEHLAEQRATLIGTLIAARKLAEHLAEQRATLIGTLIELVRGLA